MLKLDDKYNERKANQLNSDVEIKSFRKKLRKDIETILTDNNFEKFTISVIKDLSWETYSSIPKTIYITKLRMEYYKNGSNVILELEFTKDKFSQVSFKSPAYSNDLTDLSFVLIRIQAIMKLIEKAIEENLKEIAEVEL